MLLFPVAQFAFPYQIVIAGKLNQGGKNQWKQIIEPSYSFLVIISLVLFIRIKVGNLLQSERRQLFLPFKKVHCWYILSLPYSRHWTQQLKGELISLLQKLWGQRHGRKQGCPGTSLPCHGNHQRPVGPAYRRYNPSHSSRSHGERQINFGLGWIFGLVWFAPLWREEGYKSLLSPLSVAGEVFRMTPIPQYSEVKTEPSPCVNPPTHAAKCFMCFAAIRATPGRQECQAYQNSISREQGCV